MSKRICVDDDEDSENGHHPSLADERRLSRKSFALFGTSNGNNWKEALIREQQANERNDIVPVHEEVRIVMNKAVFFKDSPYTAYRWLQFVSVPILNIIIWEVGASNWTINLGYNLYFSIGIGIGMLSNFAWWYTVHCEDGIRKDSVASPGIGLRAFRLLDAAELKAMASWRSWFSISSMICIIPCLTSRIIYFAIIWSDVPHWGKAIELASLGFCFFFHASVGAVIFLFMSTMEASTRLIRKQTIFVQDDDCDGGIINWEATQRNFDTLEEFTLDLSKAWFVFFFGGLIFFPLGMVMMILGLVTDALSWVRAGHQPPSKIAMLLSEVFLICNIMSYILSCFCGACDVTAACEDVNKQSRDLMAYLRKHPNFKNSTEQYMKAKLFSEYVEKEKLGFKATNLLISYTLGMAIAYPILIAISSVVLPLTIQNVKL